MCHGSPRGGLPLSPPLIAGTVEPGLTAWVHMASAVTRVRASILPHHCQWPHSKALVISWNSCTAGHETHGSIYAGLMANVQMAYHHALEIQSCAGVGCHVLWHLCSILHWTSFWRDWFGVCSSGVDQEQRSKCPTMSFINSYVLLRKFDTSEEQEICGVTGQLAFTSPQLQSRQVQCLAQKPLPSSRTWANTWKFSLGTHWPGTQLLGASNCSHSAKG